MTQEQIEQAAANHKAYAEEFSLKPDTSFICGVDWCRNHQWISVEDELPNYGTLVLVDGSCGLRLSLFMNNFVEATFITQSIRGVTHWMPIPPLSEGGEE